MPIFSLDILFNIEIKNVFRDIIVCLHRTVLDLHEIIWNYIIFQDVIFTYLLSLSHLFCKSFAGTEATTLYVYRYTVYVLYGKRYSRCLILLFKNSDLSHRDEAELITITVGLDLWPKLKL